MGGDDGFSYMREDRSNTARLSQIPSTSQSQTRTIDIPESQTPKHLPVNLGMGRGSDNDSMRSSLPALSVDWQKSTPIFGCGTVSLAFTTYETAHLSSIFKSSHHSLVPTWFAMHQMGRGPLFVLVFSLYNLSSNPLDILRKRDKLVKVSRSAFSSQIINLNSICKIPMDYKSPFQI